MKLTKNMKNITNEGFCNNCGKKGHFVRECKEDSKSVNSSIISKTLLLIEI